MSFTKKLCSLFSLKIVEFLIHYILALANEAMDQRRSWTTTTSSTDDEGEKGTKKGKIIVL